MYSGRVITYGVAIKHAMKYGRIIHYLCEGFGFIQIGSRRIEVALNKTAAEVASINSYEIPL